MSLSSRLQGVVRARTSPVAVGLARIGVGSAASVKAVLMWPYLRRVGDPDLLHLPYPAVWSPVEHLPAPAVGVLWFFAAAAFTFGWYTTAAGVALSAALLVTLGLDQQLYSNHLVLLTCLVALLTLANCGASVSLDERRGAGRNSVAYWPVALLKTQISTMYLFAGLAKINWIYLSGIALAYYGRWEGPLALPALLRRVEILAPLAVLSVLAELALALGLWIPKYRLHAAVGGILLHLGMIGTLTAISTLEFVVFAVASISIYPVFFARVHHGVDEPGDAPAEVQA